MSGGDLLVELDAEARRGGRDDVAVLPCDRSLQDLGVEAAPVEDSLENEEVRAAGAELDVGGADHGAAVQVRRDLRVVRLGQRGDLLPLQEATDPAEVELQDR